MADLNLNVQLRAFDNASNQLKKIRNAGGRLAQQFDANRKKLAAMNQTLKNLQGFQKLRGELQRDAVELAKVNEKAKTLESQLRNARGAGVSAEKLKSLRAQYERAKAESDKLSNAHVRQMQRLNQLRSSLNAAGVNTRRLSDEERRLRGEAKETNSALTRQSMLLERAASRSRRMEAARTRLGERRAVAGAVSSAGMAGVGTGGAALYGLGRLISPGIEYEAQMSRVGAIAGLDKNSAEMKALDAQAKALGSSTRYSATEVGSGQQFLAMAGFKAQDIQKAMPDMLSLATVGNIDLGQTADIASNILSAFKLPAEEMGRVADTMSAAITKTNVDVSMLGDTMKYVAPQAAAVGASVEEAAAMAGLLGNIGIQGTQAGTAMRALYSRMAAPPKMARKALKELNIQTKDAAGNMRAMPDILAEIAKKTEKMGTADRLKYFKAIAGEEAGSAMAELVSQAGAGAITKFRDVLQDQKGTAGKTAAAMADNLKGDIIGLKSAWEGFSIAIAGTNSGPLRQLTKSITKIVRGITEWVNKNPRLAGTILKAAAAAAALLAVGGGLLMTIAAFMTPLALIRYGFAALGPVLQSAGSAIVFVGRALLTAGRFMMANPIALVITAIAGAAYLLYKYWDDVCQFLKNTWNSITSWWSETWSLLKTDTLAGLQRIGEVILNWSPLGLVYKAFAGVMRYFGFEMPDNLSQALADAGRTIMNKIAEWDVLGWFKNAMSSAFKWVDDKIESLKRTWQKIKAFFTREDEEAQSVYNYTAEHGGKRNFAADQAARRRAAMNENLERDAALYQQKLSALNVALSKGEISFTEHAKRVDAITQQFGGPERVQMMMASGLLLGQNLGQGMAKGIESQSAAIAQASANAAQGAIAAARKVGDVHSPSRVMAEIGQFFSQGFAVGIDKAGHQPAAAMANVANGIKKAAGHPTKLLRDFVGIPAAVGALSTALPLAAHPVSAAPPLSQSAAPVAQAAAPVINITINGGAAPDTAQAIAREVERVLRAHQEQQRARTNRALYDI